jgi:formylglycine-generating enzyme required for sulfatase activity
MQRLWQQVASGSLRPNGVGLYDTSGHAAEWVEDCWNDFYRMRAEGRIAPDMVSGRVQPDNQRWDQNKDVSSKTSDKIALWEFAHPD